MNACELFDSDAADVEMYFYGELDPADGVRVERHLRGCAACRQRLDDLHAIRRALAARPVVDAPPAGDWSGFMRRLDAAVAEPSNLRAFEPQNPDTNSRTREPWNPRTWIALAAMLALAAIGVVLASRFRPVPDPHMAMSAPGSRSPAEAGTAKAGEAATAKAGHTDRALREGSVEHLERSKLVVLGLATRDPHARARDWQYERALAGTLLRDTRLYRQAAMQDGAADVERVMRDLETVLLEASMSDKTDRTALERVQRLIAKRDLVVKMQVMAAGN
jgi:anti-sigma factor RsiW